MKFIVTLLFIILRKNRECLKCKLNDIMLYLKTEREFITVTKRTEINLNVIDSCFIYTVMFVIVSKKGLK